MHPTEFQISWPFDSGEEAKKKKIHDSNYGGHLGFPIRTILAIFDLQVTLMLPTKIQVNWPFDSGEAKIGFQDGGQRGYLRLPIGMILAL